MRKRLLLLPFALLASLAALPLVIACADTADSTPKHLKTLTTALQQLNLNVNNVVLNPLYKAKPDPTDPNKPGNLLANNLNMFKLLLNDSASATEDEELNQEALDGIFSVPSYEWNADGNGTTATTRIDFNFNYDVCDSANQTARPYLSSNKRAIIVPVLASLVDLRAGETILATKFWDFFSLQIQDVAQVDNNEDLGFNGLPGKRVVFSNLDAEAGLVRGEFLSIPNEIVDNYLDFQSILPSAYQMPVEYDLSTLRKWKDKTFTEVKSISGAISNPANQFFLTGNRAKEYSFSILDSAFDQKQWQYPRFNIRFQPANFSSISQTNAKLYGLVFSKKYTYIDKRFKFKRPSDSDISSEKSKNDSLASDLAKTVETSNLYLPVVNFTRDDVKTFGVDKIVEFFNKTKKQFLPAPAFTYTLLGDDQREIWFEITSARKEEGADEAIIVVDISLNVARKELKGAATFSKKFDTKNWKWI